MSSPTFQSSFRKLKGAALAGAFFLFSPPLAWSDPIRNPSEHNLVAGVGLKGFDPVAVFPEGGRSAARGLDSLSLVHEGVEYRFSKLENLELFRVDPSKYEPTYGGWCAYAMASGSKVDIQPGIFTIHGRRAHYFVGNRAKQNFDRDIEGHESRADGHWKAISGEEPRI